MDLTSPSKNTIWQTGLKRNIQQSVVYRRPISLTETNTGLRWKAWKKFYQGNCSQKQAGVEILISDKVEFKLTLIKGDKGHSMIIKGEMHQKEITIINLNTPNESAPNFIKHTLKDLKTHIDSNTVIVGDFNNPHHQ
jgi:hypothetical protein